MNLKYKTKLLAESLNEFINDMNDTGRTPDRGKNGRKVTTTIA